MHEALEMISGRLNIEISETDYFNIEEQIVPQIIDSIKKADAVIADISNENPNIYYEVGIAHAFGKPVILVSQTNNFNRFSLLSYRFYNYNSNPNGIKTLSFQLEQILSNSDELNRLKPVSRKKRVLDFEEFINLNRVDEISKLTGATKYFELERWIYELLKEIPGFEVQRSEQKSGKEYDFILWNSSQAEELIALGNPIPIEVKSSHYIKNNLLHSLISKAISQGFKSFILITIANLTEGNKKLIRNLKAHSGIAILVIEKDDLRSVHSSKDLFKILIKSFRKFFID